MKLEAKYKIEPVANSAPKNSSCRGRVYIDDKLGVAVATNAHRSRRAAGDGARSDLG